MKNLDITFIIALISGLVTFIWTAYTYFDARKRDQNLKEFEIYHKLIRELVQPDGENGLYMDRQSAILYELRNFKRYYPFSYRTLAGLQKKWLKNKEMFPSERLLEEVQLTIDFLKNKKIS